MQRYSTMLGIALAVAALLVLPAVGAQAQDTATQAGPPARIGIAPGHPLFGVERFFENIGTMFTFGAERKAQRFLNLASERLEETEALAHRGDEKAQRAAELYPRFMQKAKQKADTSGSEDVMATVASSTTKHLSVLDRVSDQVPAQAQEAIAKARETSVQGQIESLNALSEQNPGRAAGIFAKAAKARTESVRDAAEGGNADAAEERAQEFEQYAEFGRGLAETAQGIRTGTTTVEQVVGKAASHHMQVLQDVQERVPPQAQEGIQRALQNAQRMQEQLPAPARRQGPPEEGQQQGPSERPGAEKSTTSRPAIPDQVPEQVREKARDFEECGPPPGAPGNWECVDGGWQQQSQGTPPHRTRSGRHRRPANRLHPVCHPTCRPGQRPASSKVAAVLPKRKKLKPTKAMHAVTEARPPGRPVTK